MADTRQIHSLHVTADYPAEKLEKLEIQELRAIKSVQAQFLQKTTELQLAIHRHALTAYKEEPTRKQPVFAHAVAISDAEKHVLVEWDGHHDPMDPRSMGRFRKWLIALTISLTVHIVCIASSMYVTTYAQITAEFQCSRDIATLGLSLFVLGQGVGPPFFSPMSEVYGRRPVYRLSIVFVVIWLIPCALAPNMQILLIARFFSGLSGSAIVSTAGATIGDLFAGNELETAMLLYTISSLSAPQIGWLVGGFISQNSNWRWIFYSLIISTFICLVAVFTIIPETYHPIMLKKKAKYLRESTGDTRWKAPMEIDAEDQKPLIDVIGSSILRPFQLLLLEPMVLNLCILSALILGIVYLFFGEFNIIFPKNHGFTLEQVGLSFQGLLIGQLVGVSTRPFWLWYVPRLIARKIQGLKSNVDKEHILAPEPEYRLLPAITGGALVPVGLLWFAWTAFPSIHWIVPIVGSGFFGIGSALIRNGVFTYLVDAYPDYSASALAANIFLGSSFAAGFPFIGAQLYEKLSFQYAGTILAAIMIVMAPFPYFFYKNGQSIRKTSRYANADKERIHLSRKDSEIDSV